MHRSLARRTASRRPSSTFGLATVFVLAVGCGSAADPAPTSGGPSGQPAGEPAQTPPPSTPPAEDAGPPRPPPPSATYPAFTPDMAQLVNHGGTILKSPVFITITWPNEPNVDAFEKLGDVIGASAYWQTSVGEYGVGVATSGQANHVRMPTALGASLQEAALTALITTNATRGTWPAATAETLYILYLPQATKLIFGDGSGDACASGTGGYHDSLLVAGKQVAYAVILQCDGFTLDDATVTASHEMAEAAVDPIPDESTAWQGVDVAHYSWELMQRGQDENGDLCEFYDDFLVRAPSPEVPWAVQRLWSNQSAAAGHAPCVPAVPGAYFNATPIAAGADDLLFDLSAQQGPPDQKAKGFKIAVGETRTIPIGYYSDAPSDAWTLSAIEMDPFADTPDPFAAAPDKQLELSLDKTTGQNGDKATLTVKVTKALTTKSRLVILVSTLGAQKHYMPLLVGGS